MPDGVPECTSKADHLLSRNNIVVIVIPHIIQNVIRGMDDVDTVNPEGGSVDMTSETDNIILVEIKIRDSGTGSGVCHQGIDMPNQLRLRLDEDSTFVLGS